MSITGAGFSISGNAPSSVAVGTSETITLQYDFNENTDGTLSFNTNDPSKGTINFPLQGMLLPRFTATTGTFTALTSATNANISSDDDYVDNLNIGFNFNYFGRDYDKFAVSSNGFLILGNGSTNLFSSYTSNNLFDGAGGTRPVIAPLWDDLNMASGTVSYKTEGTSGDRVLTVEWLNAKWDYDASSAVISFQVKMYEANGKVEFIYQQETGTLSSPSASIGLTNAYVGTTSFLSLSDATGSPTASNTNETSNIDTKPATGQVYSFTPTLAPTITGFTPAQAVVGTSVTITGTNFSTTSGLNTVKFNGVTATVTSATTTELQTTVPAGATTGKITVEVNNLTATSSTDFTVTLSANAPSITSFTPAQAIIGTSVTITGTNFSATAANNTVKFNGVTATVTSATATQIQTTVPVGATTGKITVEVNGETAISSTDFTVTTSSVTALPQNLNEAKLILFPNPMRDVLRMEVKGKTNGTQVTIVILNNQGNEVLSTSKSLLNGQLELPIQELAAGQYLIKIHIGDEVILRRIVKL
jgi:ribosomal protein L21E